MYEQQRENLRGARFNLESQVLAIENANVNKETMDAMRTGAQAMKSIHGQLYNHILVTYIIIVV